MAMSEVRSFLGFCMVFLLVFAQLNEGQAFESSVVLSDLLMQAGREHYRIKVVAECGSRCTIRCSATAYKKPCMFFFQKCCGKCLCVPPGTYGNKQTCLLL